MKRDKTAGENTGGANVSGREKGTVGSACVASACTRGSWSFIPALSTPIASESPRWDLSCCGPGFSEDVGVSNSNAWKCILPGCEISCTWACSKGAKPCSSASSITNTKLFHDLDIVLIVNCATETGKRLYKIKHLQRYQVLQIDLILTRTPTPHPILLSAG